MEKKLTKKLLALLLSLTLIISAGIPVSAISVPKYSNKAYVAINDNEPSFTKTEKKSTEAFENYSSLDSLGRCGVAYANICKKIMPTEERGDISSIHPTGWHTGMGWERCHLIGFQLAGENANKKNLITGTGYLNRTGMLPFENMVADYVEETNNHVLYRVTPHFTGSNLVANGVQMEAWSVEDNGDGICFNVYCYNVEPGKTINYATGVISSKKITPKLVSGTYKQTYQGDAIKKGSKSFSINAETDTEAKLTYSKTSGNSKITVSKSGKVTVKKGLSAGTYKVKVKIKSQGTNASYAKTFTKTLTIKITKPTASKTKKKSSDSGVVYWTPSGSVYHKSPDCPTLSRSKTINKGTIPQSGKTKGCKICS